MKIVEILDSVGINSFNIQSWIEECQKFKEWYLKSGVNYPDEIEMENAYLKVLPLKEIEYPEITILNKNNF